MVNSIRQTGSYDLEASSSAGGVIRDHKGRFLLSFGRKKIYWDISQLELEGILVIREHRQSWIFDYKGVIIEGDNINIIKFIREAMERSRWK
ncbi:hypothetical protein M5K25_001969 [Dendrobium thyrsiflorum]|uniref:RNase H type-1 domain-containing protein n=1 Tax=Dendrobium thyrsiflorum TaxID=117978 RepID=A0ABD0W0I0_DENTH